MKLMLLRQSGRPVDNEKAKAFESEWRQIYDKAEVKAEVVFKKTFGKLQTTPKMIILQRYLRFAERQLTLKHGSEEMIDIPKSARAWETLISKYEDVPIMVARRTDKGIVLILMDQLQG
jgi:hypothetical protein